MNAEVAASIISARPDKSHQGKLPKTAIEKSRPHRQSSQLCACLWRRTFFLFMPCVVCQVSSLWCATAVPTSAACSLSFAQNLQFFFLLCAVFYNISGSWTKWVSLRSCLGLGCNEPLESNYVLMTLIGKQWWFSNWVTPSRVEIENWKPTAGKWSSS